MGTISATIVGGTPEPQEGPKRHRLMRTRMASCVAGPEGLHRLYGFDAWREWDPATDGDAIITTFAANNAHSRGNWVSLASEEAGPLLAEAFPEYAAAVKRVEARLGEVVYGTLLWVAEDLQSETLNLWR